MVTDLLPVHNATPAGTHVKSSQVDGIVWIINYPWLLQSVRADIINSNHKDGVLLHAACK
jgi:hypothetical protein